MKNTINSNSQMHGKAFENMLKAVFNASDTKRGATNAFDIEAKFNKEHNLPISIKTVKKGGSVCLSDARRFFENTSAFVMLIGEYEQKDDRKIFKEIKEIIISEDNLKKLKGNLSFQDVEDFHNALTDFKYGEHIEAREFAKEKQKELKDKTVIKLNPKIDSKTQRRLQCSVDLTDLISIVGDDNVTIHKEQYSFLQLPIVIYSEARKMSKKESPEVLAAKALDKFYTKPIIAEACIEETIAYVKEKEIVVEEVIEPSAGSGAFSQCLNKFGNVKEYSFDIEPQSEGIVQQDYLELDTEQFGENTIVIGNPPFGKNSSLAIKFFNKSAEYAKLIAFVVPKTFKKDSVVNKLDKNFHLVKEIELPESSFLVLDEETDVPCVFQIWEKRSEQRARFVKDIVCDDYDFVKRENADWAFQRVGVKAGALKNKARFSSIADASHIFMSFKNDQDAIIFSLIDWEKVKFNTAGNPSISKNEMKAEYLKAKSQFKLLMKDLGATAQIIDRGAIFEDETGVHLRVLEEGVMKKYQVRILFDNKDGKGYSATYNFVSYPFTVT